MIYVYKHIDVKSHHGFLKIGETTNSVQYRVKIQNEADNVRYSILRTFPAVKHNGKEFRDIELHHFLTKNGIEREPIYDNYGNPTGRYSEWFKINLITLLKLVNIFLTVDFD